MMRIIAADTLRHHTNTVQAQRRLTEAWRATLASERGDIDFHRLVLSALLWLLPEQSVPRLRAAVYRMMGLRIGKRTLIRGAMYLSGPPGCFARLTVGQYCFFTAPIRIDLNAPVSVGDGVTIGHDVSLLTSGHEIGGPSRRCGSPAPKPIHIHDGSWIGAHALVLPGVSIGEGAIVAAGATVVRDVAPHTIVAGSPARVVRELPSGHLSPA